MSMNTVNLTGRLGKEPELKTTNSGKSVIAFSIAVQDGKDRTYWLPIVAWEKTAEFISRFFRKGDGIEITGKLTERKYEDQNGNKRSVVEVVATNVGFPQGKSDNATDGSESPYKASGAKPSNPSNPGKTVAYGGGRPSDGGYNGFEDVDSQDLPF